MSDQQLAEYITSQKASGATLPQIKEKLLAAGWNENQIDAELGLNNVPKPKSPPSPTGGMIHSMFYTFQHVLMFLTMAIYAFSINGLINVLIDRWFKDSKTSGELYRYMGNYFSTTYVRGLLAAIIVSYPIFIIFFLKLKKQALKEPTLRLLHSKVILTYLTLIITFTVVIAKVVKVVYDFLNGAVSLNTFLHFLTPVIICTVIFAYFLTEIRGRKTDQ